MSKTPKKVPTTTPQDDEKDDYDRMDEMFLQLNNALEEKETEIKEADEMLQEQKKQLEKEQADLRDERRELEDLREELKEQRKKLEKDQEMFQKDQQVRNFKDKQSATKSRIIDDIKTENYSLKAELRNLKNHGTPAPGIFLEIPDVDISNSYRFVKNLNPSFSKYYTRFTRKYPAIEEALRKAHAKAKQTGFKAKLQQIGACFYATQMTADNPEEILAAINHFLDECELVDDLEVERACEEFRDNIMDDLKKEVEEWRRKNPR